MSAAATATGAEPGPRSAIRQDAAPAEATTQPQYEPGGADSLCGGQAAMDDEERAPTLKWLPAVFFGQEVPPHPAHLPLPAHVVIGSTDQTRLEKTPRSR